METLRPRYDVVVIGAGLAGLSLVRHLLLQTQKTVLLLDKQNEVPGTNQKVGESLVQLGGYYFSKVLDLQEHLLQDHYLKYNLRFHWKTPGRSNCNFEDYSQAYIRPVSNIPTFQLDRNVFERYLFEENCKNPRCQFRGGIRKLDIEFSAQDDHRVVADGIQIQCSWVVDASGRSAYLKRTMSLERSNSIRHGATWCWVNGLVDIERLTDRNPTQIRLDPRRKQTGHFPHLLATNHFCAEAQWFWVITLHSKTSLGLVYDRSKVPAEEVSTARKMIDYVCRQWPLFSRDLPNRTILDEGRFIDFSYDAKQTINPLRWAITGDAGRFLDPLYSLGSDLISVHNTLIVDAILTEGAEALSTKCVTYEQLMRFMYEAYIPSYSLSYDCLGDAEAFTLKYAWELSVYFGFYVLPFINDLLLDPEFLRYFLVKFANLGAINKNLQKFLSDFYQWKRARPNSNVAVGFTELFDLLPLRESEKLFYQVGISRSEAETVLADHVQRLREFASFILAHVHAVVLDDRDVLLNGDFVTSLNPRNTIFDPEQMRSNYANFSGSTEVRSWNLNPFALESYLPQRSQMKAESR